MAPTLLTGATLTAGLWLAVGVALFSRMTPGYDWTRHTISELATPRSPYQLAVRLTLFLPVGLLCLLPALVWFSEGRLAAGSLSLSLSIGYLGATLFRADPGSPLKGSHANQIHNATGAIMYAGSGFSLIAATGQVPGFLATGILTLIALTALGPNDPTGYRGGLQRLIEALLFVSLILHTS